MAKFVELYAKDRGITGEFMELSFVVNADLILQFDTEKLPYGEGWGTIIEFKPEFELPKKFKRGKILGIEPDDESKDMRYDKPDPDKIHSFVVLNSYQDVKK